ncbi:dihydrofolate reductase family protein [Tessaracoccus sp.]|uniref:dihydrofolate reductase family protein n=1 Tax=Tessaracoccus sp. TaxID=1971211 RepID=UPI00262EB2BF|nr:dihydrofolate reductase family protein [Tessaracoccus sp.]
MSGAEGAGAGAEDGLQGDAGVQHRAALGAGRQQLARPGAEFLAGLLDHADLRLAAVLGARTVVADSGGTLNAALLRAGLVDEIDVVTLPGLVGGLGTPSIMDGAQLDDTQLPIRAELIDCQVTSERLVRTRYRVINQAGPKRRRL